MKASLVFPFIVSMLLLTGCPKQQSAPGTDAGYSGYALLYSVTSQEQNVDKLLWVKDPGAEIEAWVRKIADFNKVVTAQLDAWKKDGTVTNLKQVDLPAAEETARKRAASRTTGELLFSKDVDLRVALVVAQLKAMGYCSDLCYAIGEATSNADVKKTVGDWQKQFAALNSEGMNILEVAMTSTQPGTESEADKTRPPAFHKQ